MLPGSAFFGAVLRAIARYDVCGVTAFRSPSGGRALWLINLEERVVRRILIAAVLGLSACGCQEKEPEVVFLRPMVHWEDVAGGSINDVKDGFVNLAPSGTDGTFPASVAIARVTVLGDASPQPARRMKLAMAPANDFLVWNRLFDNLRFISEAFPLNERDLGESPPSIERIVWAARALDASLVLVYGQSDPSQNESLVRGVLYRTNDATPLAAIDARAEVFDPEELTRPPEDLKDDDSYCDPRVLADRRFERLVLDCILDLRLRDRPVPPKAPEGWIPDGPVEPRTWPPATFGYP